MRKFKEVKRKEIIYSSAEWKQIEKAAAKVSMQTSEYICKMSLNGEVTYLNMEGVTPVINAMRIMGNNINQIAKKANETNSIYADDLEILKKIQEELCRTLNLYLSILTSNVYYAPPATLARSNSHTCTEKPH